VKFKITLEHDETIEQAEEFLEKSLAHKKECSEERYTDNFLNEFHSAICKKHHDLVYSIVKEIQEEIIHDVNKKGHF
jgi:hypothetical protein